MLQVLTRPFQFINMFSCRKGVFWLLVAIVAEIPPVVRLKSFFGRRYFTEIYVSGIHYFELKRYSSSLSLSKTPLNPTL